MSGNFQNAILIVVFNYANCTHHKEFLQQLYRSHFKQIIFYSDLPNNQVPDPDVNYVNIHRGHFAHRIFPHFYQKYRKELEESVGLFYTMDDNIINMNLLSTLDSQKIIQFHVPLKSIDEYHGWQWDCSTGKPAIKSLLASGKLENYSLDKFCGGFADYFYLPIKYCTTTLFELFKLFGEYNIFLELAIPTIVNFIDQNEQNYLVYTAQVLWNADREKVKNREWLENALKTDLIIHPIKFNSQPEAKNWLFNIFYSRKCIVITTINNPTHQILHYAELKDWRLIIVGDSKTDDSVYRKINCVYLGLKEQAELFPSLFEKIPLRSYTRKMFGYLYAIQHKYQLIYDTDDDNKFIGNLNEFSPNSKVRTVSQEGFNNLYRIFTDKQIWPRGIPPTHSSIFRIPLLSEKQTNLPAVVIQGLVNNDPDVDAHYRIHVSSESFVFEKNEGYDIVCDKYAVCPFNTQNTFWLDPTTFFAMYLPVTVTFRYTDILRGFIALYQLWKQNKTIRFTVPTAIQERNEHDLRKDYESEIPMYKTAEKVIALLNENKSATLREIYSILIDQKIVLAEELSVLDEWLKLVEKN